MSSTVVKDVEKVNSIVWFRNDLRAVDHSGLSHAIENSKNVIGVYCFNPHQFKLNNLGFPKTDSFRANFLIESVKCLKEELKKINISLVIGVDKPESLISNIILKKNIGRVYLQDEWTEEEIKEEDFLKKLDIDIFKFNDQFLYHPQDVDIKNVSNVFTNFRKYCEKKLHVRQSFGLNTKMNEDNLIEDKFLVPTLKDLGLNNFNFDHRSADNQPS